MRKLRKSEVNRIIKENASLSNEELLNKYFDFNMICKNCLYNKRGEKTNDL